MKPVIIKWVKSYGMLLLAAAMLFKAFLAPAVFIDFKLNQEYIAKVLCINKEKPQLECNGQCILMQKMKAAQESENPEQNPAPKSQLLEIFTELKSIYHPISFQLTEKKYFEYSASLVVLNFSKIFHPPQSL